MHALDGGVVFAGLETLVAALQQEMAEVRAKEPSHAMGSADQTSRTAAGDDG